MLVAKVDNSDDLNLKYAYMTAIVNTIDDKTT